MSRNKALTRARSARAKGTMEVFVTATAAVDNTTRRPRRAGSPRAASCSRSRPRLVLAQHPCDRAPDHQMNRPGAAVEDEVDLTIGAPGGDVLAATPTARILGLRRVP